MQKEQYLVLSFCLLLIGVMGSSRSLAEGSAPLWINNDPPATVVEVRVDPAPEAIGIRPD